MQLRHVRSHVAHDRSTRRTPVLPPWRDTLTNRPPACSIMATPPPVAAAPAAASPASKNAPHLHSVASSLRSCLDGMLPDHLRNDAAAFHAHRAWISGSFGHSGGFSSLHRRSELTIA